MRKVFFLWLAILFVYLFFAGRGSFSFRTTQRNFFSLQAYSWLQGHIDLVVLPRDTTDLSFYQGKAYFYYPPLSTLFALPFVFLFGVGVSDIFYTAFWASTPPILLFLVLKKARKIKFIPRVSDKTLLLLTIFFAFGTVFFYLSVLGTVWFTSQIISMIPLIASILFLFEFVSSKKSRDFNISVLLLCFAFWGRIELILALFLHIYVLIKTHTPKKKIIFISMLTILSMNMIVYGLYNFIRFGNPWESGINYMVYNPKFNDIKKYGFFNFPSLSHNLFYFLVNPIGLKDSFPFIVPNPEGNSIFSTSPLFLLLMSFLSGKYWKQKILSPIIFLLTSGLIILSFLFYSSTGWFQFGYRYALDVIPFLILALAWVIDDYPRSFVEFLFLISIIINTLGTVWMLQMAPLLKY